MSLSFIMPILPPIYSKSLSICSFLKAGTRNRSLTCMTQGKRFLSSSIYKGFGRISCTQKTMTISLSMPAWTSCYTTPILSKGFALLRPHGFRYSTKKQSLPFEKNTSVTKNVMIFSNKDDRFYKLMSLFGLVQFLFWGYLSMFCYFTLKDVPVETDSEQSGEISEKSPWWRLLNLGQNKYKNGIALLCFSIGYVVLFIAAMYPLRAVQSLWLLKGGKSVGVITFGPFGKKFSFVSPLEEISCVQSRAQAASQIPLKIKDRWFFFLLDKKGEFHNQELFDFTVGLKRNLK